MWAHLVPPDLDTLASIAGVGTFALIQEECVCVLSVCCLVLDVVHTCYTEQKNQLRNYWSGKSYFPVAHCGL